MTTLPTYDPTLFEGAAWYYARYRPKYPPVLFERLSEVFQLDGTGRLLDLGCGAGLIAIPFRDRFEHIVGLDPDPAMLNEAQQEAEVVGASNITWVEQVAELISPTLGEFRLITIGRAFHWMQRELVLERGYELLSSNGGVAIIKTHEDPWNSEHPWKKTAIAVIKRWLGDQRRTGQGGTGVWKPLDVSHEEILAKSPFPRQATYEVKYEKYWTIDTYVGYLYSTAFCLPSFVGDKREQFEADLKESLLSVEPSGQFKEELPISILVAWKH